jgi:hypothetical protein
MYRIPKFLGYETIEMGKKERENLKIKKLVMQLEKKLI